MKKFHYAFLAASFVFIASFILLKISQPAVASDPDYQAFIKKEEILKEPILSTRTFRHKDLKENSICKFVTKIIAGQDTSPSPKIFQKIKNVYLSTTTDGTFKSDNPIFDVENVSNLAGCILEKTPSSIGDGSLPINIFQGGKMAIQGRPESADEGNLIIWIELGVRRGNAFLGDFKSPIMIVKTRFYRHQKLEINDLNYQCSEAYPFEQDQDKLTHLLTDGLSRCLVNKYQQ